MPPTSVWEIPADLPGKERQGIKVKWSKKEGKSSKKEGKSHKGKWKVESYKMIFFFFFFACHFSKPLKFILGLPKWEFSTGKKIRKNGFAPSEKHFSYAPHGWAILRKICQVRIWLVWSIGQIPEFQSVSQFHKSRMITHDCSTSDGIP